MVPRMGILSTRSDSRASQQSQRDGTETHGLFHRKHLSLSTTSYRQVSSLASSERRIFQPKTGAQFLVATLIAVEGEGELDGRAVWGRVGDFQAELGDAAF